MIIALIILLLIAVAGGVYLGHQWRETWKTLKTQFDLDEQILAVVVKQGSTIEELQRRDNVQAYEALEKGTNELIENYENDRLDLLDTIERLEKDVEDTAAMGAANALDLGKRIEFYQRAHALYHQTILDYEAELGERVKMMYADGEAFAIAAAPILGQADV